LKGIFSHPKYRSDIDGLRAVAVAPVLMYHAGVPGFGGGFVGVDVFFVISGFLITQLIHNELQKGQFSLVTFYERRMRRIFPALIAMLLVTSIIASWLLLPQNLVAYGRSLAATTMFASNFFFSKSGYFDPDAHEFPLLHTWSLAVEEQFYILYPLFIWLTYRRSPKLVLPLVALAGFVSLATAQTMVMTHPRAAFYLPVTRAWELALGCSLALAPIAAASSRQVRSALGLFGLGMILCAVFFYADEMPFPGVAALLPCVGTALILWAGTGGQGHAAADVLSWRPFVLTGLVSYSLYLWHWPLLTFAAYPSVAGAPMWVKLLALVASYLLAVLTWRWVERPFRGRAGILTRPQMMFGGATAMALILAFGWVAASQRGWPGRLAPEVEQIAAGSREHAPVGDACYKSSVGDVRSDKLCRIGQISAKPTFLLWGDSHARAMVDAVSQAARSHGRGGVIAPQAGCPPLLDVSRGDLRNRPQCIATADAILEYLRSRPNIRDVVLVSRWALLVEGSYYGPETGEPILLSDGQTHARDIADNRRIFERALSRTLDELTAAGKQVWIVGPVPEVGVDVPKTLANAKRFGRNIDIRPSRQQFEFRQRGTFDILDRVAAQHGATIVPVHENLCDHYSCEVASREGQPLYYDDDHLSFSGERAVVPALEAIFENRIAGRMDSGS
jgi:peptidoglycan/LPS O-acetylase OafA/YrhL